MEMGRKLIRHPYGYEEILIVDLAVVRPHDLPHETKMLPGILKWNEMMRRMVEIETRVLREEMERLRQSRLNWIGSGMFRIPMRIVAEPVRTA